MKMNLFLAGCCLGLSIGFYCGTTQVYKYKLQVEQLTETVKHTKKVAASCHEMIADHWSLNHQIVPGSKEIATTSEHIVDSLQGE